MDHVQRMRATRIKHGVSACFIKYQVYELRTTRLNNSERPTAEWRGCANDEFDRIKENCTCDFDKYVFYCKRTCFTDGCNQMQTVPHNWVSLT